MTITDEELATAQDLMSRCNRAQLRTLGDEYRDRAKALQRSANRVAMAKVKVGAKAHIGYGLKPQYLAGQPVTITAIRQTKITVKLENGPMGKFRSGTVVMPPSGLIFDRDAD